MRTGTWTAAAVLGLGTMGAGLPVQVRADPPDRPLSRREAAERALAWLEGQVSKLPDSEGTPRKPFTLAITGLDEWMARGTTASPKGTATLKKVKEGLLAYLDEAERRSRDPASLPGAHGVADSSKFGQYTWVLGASALFFAESAARGWSRAESEAALLRIGALLGEAQDDNGGWGHGRIAPGGAPPRGLALPAGFAGGGYPSTLVSTTNVVTLGLALARPAIGPGRDGKAAAAWDAMLAKAKDHLLRAELSNGIFPYDISQRSAHRDETGIGRSAGALAALLALGVPPTEEGVKRAANLVDERLADVAEGHGSPALNVFLAAFAARLRGPEAVRAFDRVLVPRILAKQDAEGALDCICEGRAFGVTCDSPKDGLLAGAPGVFSDGQLAYVTSLHLFALLLDAPDRLEILRPGKPAPRATVVTPGETRPPR